MSFDIRKQEFSTGILKSPLFRRNSWKTGVGNFISLRTDLEKGLEVGAAGGEDHFVCFAGLSVTGEGDVGEGAL